MAKEARRLGDGGARVLRGGESVEVLDELEEAYRSTAVLRGVESIKSSFEALKFFSVQVVSRLEAHGSSRLPLGGAQSSRLPLGGAQSSRLSRRSSHYCKPWMSARIHSAEL